MILGRVIGEVWATKKPDSLGGVALKLVAVLGTNGPVESGRVVVAADVLDAPLGEEVMVSFGSGARNVIRPGARDNRDVPYDCAISRVIDGRDR